MPLRALTDDDLPDADARLARLRWPLVMLVWAVPALLAAFETYMFWRMSGREYPFWRAVAMEAPAWLTYAVFTPVIFALGKRLPLRRPRAGRNAIVHLFVALLVGAVYAGAATTASRGFAPAPSPMPFARMMLSWYLSALPLTTLAYFAVLGVEAAISHLNEARRRETDAARLSMQLAEARLGALRMQLHPHFLFNTLNAITVLARDGDTAGVTRMLTLLSDLLRDVLRTDAAHAIPLDEELAFARRYLDIERVRFTERLAVRESIDEGTEGLLVPAFILQPLIENALRHGLAPRAAGGTIEIGARVRGSTLELRVKDDGAGLGAEWNGSDDYGIGLANTAARLRELHGDHAALVVQHAIAGGTLAVVTLPVLASTQLRNHEDASTTMLAMVQ